MDSKGAQRLGGAPAPVKRNRQPAPCTLVERVRVGPRRQVRQQAFVLTEIEPDLVIPSNDGVATQAKFGRWCSQQRFIGKFTERLAPPEAQRLHQQLVPLAQTIGRQLTFTLTDAMEHARVDILRVQLEGIATITPHDRDRHVFQTLAQTGHQHLQRLDRVGREMCPQAIDQPVRTHSGRTGRRQRREQHALLPCGRYTGSRHHQRAEHADADRSHHPMVRPPICASFHATDTQPAPLIIRLTDRGGAAMTLTTEETEGLIAHTIDAWERCAPTYATGFESLTSGATTALLDLAGVGRGTAVLDIGTGPGTLIGPALERGATVSGIDLAPAMVATARGRHPGVTVDVGDATSMTHPDASFDAVTIGFCLHHTADAPAVLREAKRVLRPGGRIAYTVWAANDRLEAFGIAFAAVAELVPEQAPGQQAPAMGEAPADHERLLSDNGFVQPTARTLDLTWALTDGAAILDGFSRFLALDDQPQAVQRRLRNRLDAEIARRAGPDHIAHIPNPAIIASARTTGN